MRRRTLPGLSFAARSIYARSIPAAVVVSPCHPLLRVYCGKQEGTYVYNECRGEYREHYIAATGNSIGDWEPETRPHYVEEFEYTIEIGEAG